MARYFVDGLEVDQKAALRRWHSSHAFASAKARTRAEIFPAAERGETAHNPQGWLAEAGVRIEPEQSHTTVVEWLMALAIGSLRRRHD